MKKLQKIFSHAFDHRVWKIVQDFDGSSLLIEERDENTSSIRIYKYSNGKMEPLPVSEMPWWSVLHSVHPGVFIACSFEDPARTSGHSYIAFDLENGQKLYQLDDIQLEEETPGGICVISGEERKWLDVATGEEMTGGGVIPISPKNNPSRFPFRYEEGSEYFNSVEEFLKNNGITGPRYVMDYLELPEYFLVSTYTDDPQGLENWLFAFREDGKLVFEKKIGENLPGITDNTFFIYNGNLIFVTSRNEFFEFTPA